MKTPEQRSTRLVTLTLLGSAAIVPALLARRMLDAKATHAEAESLCASVTLSESKGSGAGSRRDPLNDPRSDPRNASDRNVDVTRPALEKALAPQPIAKPANHPVRFFSKDEIEQATHTQSNKPKAPDNLGAGGAHSAGSEQAASGPSTTSRPFTAGALLPPVACVANVTDLGMLLSWADDPANPPGAILKSQLFRWSDTEALTPISATPPYVVPASTHEFLDQSACAGTKYSYAVLTIQLDRLEGIEVRRSALGERAIAEIPIRYRIEPIGFVVSDAKVKESTSRSDLRVRLHIFDLRETEPQRREVEATPIPTGSTATGSSPEAAAYDVGKPLGIEVGWVVAGVDRESREELVDVSVPIFNADGSRKIDNGTPASVSRNEMQTRTYPIVLLRDRCGREQTLRTSHEPPKKR